MIGIETIEAVGSWRKAIGDPSGWASRCHAAACAAEPKLAGEIALLLADDIMVRDLNARFRNKDGATNVLAFPSGSPAPGFLGDVALAYETCEREAKEKGVSITHHAAHLIVHGLLHLVGYDHQEERGAIEMEELESRILASIGVANPYFECAEAG